MNRKMKWFAPAILVLSVFLASCQTSTENQPPAPPEASKKEAAGGGAKKPGSKGGGEKQPAAQQVTVPAGTALEVRLVEGVDTGKTSEGSRFEGTLAAPLVVNGVEVASLSSSVSGEVTHVVSAGRLSKPAELSLTLDSLTPKGGDKVAISTDTWSAKGESHKKRNAEFIGGGAAGGALIGALAGGKKGAAIGALAGGGGGAGAAAYTGKKEIVLAPETKLTFKLSSPVTLTAKPKG